MNTIKHFNPIKWRPSWKLSGSIGLMVTKYRKAQSYNVTENGILALGVLAEKPKRDSPFFPSSLTVILNARCCWPIGRAAAAARHYRNPPLYLLMMMMMAKELSVQSALYKQGSPALPAAASLYRQISLRKILHDKTKLSFLLSFVSQADFLRFESYHSSISPEICNDQLVAAIHDRRIGLDWHVRADWWMIISASISSGKMFSWYFSLSHDPISPLYTLCDMCGNVVVY